MVGLVKAAESGAAPVRAVAIAGSRKRRIDEEKCWTFMVAILWCRSKFYKRTETDKIHGLKPMKSRKNGGLKARKFYDR
jgi:hypothetical protein